MSDSIVISGLTIIMIIVAPLLIMQEIKRESWLKDHCKIIGEMSSSMGVGVGLNGNVTPVVVDGKTGYQCDDGKQYWE